MTGKRPRRWPVVAASCLALLPATALGFQAPTPAEVVGNATVGIRVTRPAGWHTLTVEQNAANIRQVGPGDEELRALVARYAAAPLIAFSKYEEPFDDLSPSFKLNLRPAGTMAGRSGVEMVAALLPGLTTLYPDLVVEQAPEEVRVSGQPGGYARVRYVLRAAGRTFPTTSELWIVPRGSFFFLIGTGTRTDERTGSRAEIRRIIDSIVIDPLP